MSADLLPRLRGQPEDFEVEEIALYPPLGEGVHTHLWIEKRLMTTDEVARALAAAVGKPLREVGYAGRKDRRAVTRQWFSVPELNPAAALALELDPSRGSSDGSSIRVLDAVRHRERLRVGQLRGNRFRLLVRGVDAAVAREATRRLEEVRRRGLVNRFGSQRFGRDGANPARGAEILQGGSWGGRGGDRRHALLMISALQAAVFNRLLDLRAAHGVAVDQLMAGDLAVVHATGALLVIDDATAEGGRLERFELSPTGPIFGTKMRRPRSEAEELERQAMRDLGLPGGRFFDAPRGLRLYGDRRPLRARVEEATAQSQGETLQLDFILPAAWKK